MFETVGKIIHQQRIAQKLTIAQLAEAANVSDSYISRIELGTVKDTHITKLNKVAQALGLKLTDLFAVTPPNAYTIELVKAISDLPKDKQQTVAQNLLALIQSLK